MKLFAFFLTAAVLADNEGDRKVPPKTPEQRMAQLKSHVGRLMVDHFSGCAKTSSWESKLTKVCNRALAAYERNTRPCSFFDDGLEHGGPAPEEEEDENVRYNELDGIASINGITSGIRKWSQRYLAECGGQKNHDHLVNHSNKWRAKLTAKFNAGC